MQIKIDVVVKIILVVTLLAFALTVWLGPKIRWFQQRIIGEKLFVVTTVVGMICGLTGLMVLFVWPWQLMKWHLWELSLMPLVLLYTIWLVIMRKAPTPMVLDEKQEFDMTKAAGVTLGMSIPLMFLVFILQEQDLFQTALWFPCYLLITQLLFCTATLTMFKNK